MDAESVIVYKGEVMLAGWSESHNGGAKVTFFLRDSSELDAFRHLTVAKGKQAGHRMAIVCVEIGEDEMPVNQHDKKGGAVTKLAAMFCGQERFWQWALTNHKDSWSRAEAIALTNEPTKVAAEWIRRVCGVQSRAELDHNKAAEKIFHEKIRIPYSKSLEDASAF